MTRRTPGQRTGNAPTQRRILLSQHYQLLPAPVVIDATYAIDGANTDRTDELRAGCLMAQITSGLWVPLKLTRVASGSSGSGSGVSDTNLNVDDARFFKAGDPIIVDSGQGGQAVSGTSGALHTSVSSVDYSTNVITLDDSADNVSVGAKVYGRGALVGSQRCRGILFDTVRLLSTQPYDSTQYDTQGRILYAGLVDESLILGDIDAVKLDRTNHDIAQLAFDQEQGRS